MCDIIHVHVHVHTCARNMHSGTNGVNNEATLTAWGCPIP